MENCSQLGLFLLLVTKTLNLSTIGKMSISFLTSLRRPGAGLTAGSAQWELKLCPWFSRLHVSAQPSSGLAVVTDCSCDSRMAAAPAHVFPRLNEAKYGEAASLLTQQRPQY